MFTSGRKAKGERETYKQITLALLQRGVTVAKTGAGIAEVLRYITVGRVIYLTEILGFRWHSGDNPYDE
jgi:hypothetical protein